MKKVVLTVLLATFACVFIGAQEGSPPSNGIEAKIKGVINITADVINQDGDSSVGSTHSDLKFELDGGYFGANIEFAALSGGSSLLSDPFAEVSVMQGYYKFLENKITVMLGMLSFNGAYQLQPVVDTLDDNICDDMGNGIVGLGFNVVPIEGLSIGVNLPLGVNITGLSQPPVADHSTFLDAVEDINIAVKYDNFDIGTIVAGFQGYNSGRNANFATSAVYAGGKIKFLKDFTFLLADKCELTQTDGTGTAEYDEPINHLYAAVGYRGIPNLSLGFDFEFVSSNRTIGDERASTALALVVGAEYAVNEQYAGGLNIFYSDNCTATDWQKNGSGSLSNTFKAPGDVDSIAGKDSISINPYIKLLPKQGPPPLGQLTAGFQYSVSLDEGVDNTWAVPVSILIVF